MRVAVAVLFAACGHAAPQPESAGMLCARYGYEMLVLESHETYDGPDTMTAVDAAQAAAQEDIANANAASDADRALDAAHAYLACARRFAGVPDGDPMIGTAIYDAHVCYDDAIWAFANAGRYAAEGRAALAAAAGADPRDAEYIRKQLAEQWSECAK